MQLILAAQMPDISDPKQGRYAELKQLIENERSLVPTTFFLFGGGSIGPSALSNLDRGSHIIDILNSLEPDAMGVSKREFSYSIEELSLRSYEAAFPIVSSNIIDKRIGSVPDGLVNMALITRNNVKLGFISITDERLVSEYLLNDIVILDTIKAVKAIVEELRNAGADFIILHYYDDLPEVTSLLDEKIIDYAFISNNRLRDSIKAKLAKRKQILILDKPGQAIVAKFDLSADEPLLSIRSLDLSTLPADSSVENQVNAYLLRLNRLLDDNIAFWGDLYSTRLEEVRSKESSFANFVVDTMLEFGKADIALINAGSIRGDNIYKKNTQITRKTIATELPYRSSLRVISISGKQLVDALEVGFAGLDLLKGAFPQVSGMKVTFNSSAPQGRRVISVSVNGKPLDNNKKYRLATTDYLAAGGDGYISFTSGEKLTISTIDQTILISDLVLRKLIVRGTLDSQVEQRIIDKVSNP